MLFTEEDMEWVEKCKAEPHKYSIKVDNDAVFVIWDDPDADYTFSLYGKEFIIALLAYLGCEADFA